MMPEPATTSPSRIVPASATAAPPSHKWRVVFVLWFVCFFNYAVFPELEREFGFNKEQLGLIGLAFMWVYAGGALYLIGAALLVGAVFCARRSPNSFPEPTR